MSNSSASGGYLQPAPQFPQLPGELTFNQFLQQVFQGVSGLPGELVRPKWQVNPPKQPDLYTNWLAIALTKNKGDTFPWNSTSPGQQAAGFLKIIRNPLPSDTVTLNGIVITFVITSPTDYEVMIGEYPNETAQNLCTFLQNSENTALTVATYTSYANSVNILYGVIGTAGNAYTLAKSNPVIPGIFLSGPTLTNGGTADSYFQNMEELEVQCAFYGPQALEMSSLVRDGFQIQQNLEGLGLANMGYVACSEATHVPDLLNERWVDRYEATYRFRREVQRVYPVLYLLSARGTITCGLDSTTQAFAWVVDNL